ncbi:hypothetical protein ACOMHN_052105 [Nucella lapillus]
MEVILSQRGGQKLCLDGYMYVRKLQKRDWIRWQCVIQRSAHCKGGRGQMLTGQLLTGQMLTGELLNGQMHTGKTLHPDKCSPFKYLERTTLHHQ